MERIQAHRGCYRSALSLLKQEFGTVTVAGTILIMAGMMQVMWYQVCLAKLPTTLLGTGINVALQLIWWIALTGPLVLGVLRWFYFIPIRVVGLFEVFYYLTHRNDYRKAVSFSLQMLWRVGLAFILGYAPGGLINWAVETYSSTLLQYDWLYSLLMVLGALLLIVGLSSAFYHCCGSFLATFFLFEEQFPTATQCIHYSSDSMKGHRTDVAILILSLFPIYLTSVLIVPLFFIVPYLLLLCVYRGRELLDYIERLS